MGKKIHAISSWDIAIIILVPVDRPTAKLGPGAVLVLDVLSIAVVWGVLIRRQTDARLVAWVPTNAPSITVKKDKRK